MPLLEVFVYYDKQVIYDRPFFSDYSQKVLDDSTRETLIDAITIFAANAFEDQLQSFATDSHQIQMHKQELRFPSDSFEGKDKEIYIYAISDNGTNKKAIAKAITEILFKFVNRFTLFDIINKNTDQFFEFNPRVDEMCKLLIDPKLRDKEKNGKKLEKEAKRAKYIKQMESSRAHLDRY